MYTHATPIDFESAPVHGAYPVDAPRVPVTLRLELTQEEAAAMLATFTVGLTENDPRIRPADVPAILGRVIADVALYTIRNEAVPSMADARELSPEDGPWYEWCRRIVRPVIPRQRARRTSVPAGSAVAR